MKIKLLIFGLILSTITLFAGDNLLQSFSAKSDGKVITVEWKSGDESGIAMYELERANSGNFSFIFSQDAKGNYYNYKYVDEDAFLKNGNDNSVSGNLYSYRIKIVKNDNSYVYSNSITVVHNVSGIRRTWGMIKELFR